MGFLDKILGRGDDYDYDFDYDAEPQYEEYIEPDSASSGFYGEAPEVQPMPTRTRRQPQEDSRHENSRVVDLKTKSYQQQVVVTQPHNLETAQKVCDFVREGKTVICNIERIDPKITQRVIDYLTGAAYGLNGRVMEITTFVFVIAPGTTNLRNTALEIEEDHGPVSDYVRRAGSYGYGY